VFEYLVGEFDDTLTKRTYTRASTGGTCRYTNVVNGPSGGVDNDSYVGGLIIAVSRVATAVAGRQQSSTTRCFYAAKFRIRKFVVDNKRRTRRIRTNTGPSFRYSRRVYVNEYWRERTRDIGTRRELRVRQYYVRADVSEPRTPDDRHGG